MFEEAVWIDRNAANIANLLTANTIIRADFTSNKRATGRAKDFLEVKTLGVEIATSDSLK